MTDSRLAGLRSVALNVPDLKKAEEFYTGLWQLDVAARAGEAVYLRGTGADHHLLSLHRADRPAVRNITFRVRSAEALVDIARSAAEAGGRLIAPPAKLDEPGGGTAVLIGDPQGRVFRTVHGDEIRADAREARDRPIRLSHVVLNSENVATAQGFAERAMGFKLSDRTRMMAFLRCNRDHHNIAFADADGNSLNHIAFLMPDIDSVMRGGGRLSDAGCPIVWGPGRHGPGNNVFNYFIDPFGFVIEYTAEVLEVDDSYRTGGPEDWKWPPGRIDHWGISPPPGPRLKDAQKAITFAAA